MNAREAAEYLGVGKDDVRRMVTDGIRVPSSLVTSRLSATPVGSDFDIDDDDLARFLANFDQAEPGRHPPMAVQRSLRVEGNDRCEICEGEGPFQFHHIIDWAKIKHHDPEHMLLVCCNCHAKLTRGEIDRVLQRQFKLKRVTARGSPIPPSMIRVDWSGLRDIVPRIQALLAMPSAPTTSQGDFTATDIETKNALNKITQAHYALMKDYHEPHFKRIEHFLATEANDGLRRTYHAIVDEIRLRYSVADPSNSIGLTVFLLQLYDAALDTGESVFLANRDMLNVLFSFMYFNCDIGRKS